MHHTASSLAFTPCWSPPLHSTGISLARAYGRGREADRKTRTETEGDLDRPLALLVGREKAHVRAT
jgi:hypothetical protein